MDAARRHFAKTRSRSLISALGILLALAACKGGGGTSAFVNYSSPFAPPAPVSPGVLTAFYKQFFSPAENAAAAALLAGAQYALQNTSWSFTDAQGNPVGPTYNSFPLASSRANYAHAIGLTGAGQVSWDVAAGVLLLEEAGGVATGFEGEPVNLGTGVTNIVAANSQIHADLLDIVNLRRA